jgi:hypothetical protein
MVGTRQVSRTPSTDLGEPLVHLEGEGVARLRPVEGDATDAVIEGKQEVILSYRYLLVHPEMPFLNCS